MATLPPPLTPADVSRSSHLLRLLRVYSLPISTFRDRPPPTPSSSNLSSVEVVGIAVGGVLVVVVVLVLLIWLSKKNRRKVLYSRRHFATPIAVPAPTYKDPYPDPEIRPQSQESSPPSDVMIKVPLPPPPPPFSITETFGTATKPKSPPLDPQGLGGPRNWFTYEELKVATDNFAKYNLVGEGGFGCVYKGVLPSGQFVAVKQLNVGGGQGEREFRAEVEIISRVHHRNLVSLVGYCIAENQRLLVYDFVPNCTLDYYLHVKGRPVMNWPTRIRIAVGAARGLAYLHEDCHPRIIHRDIKSSNILLDNNFEAQVSDFGLAKLTTDATSHVTTRVMGTFGYLAPEYASSGKLTEKSDVFSFGVVLLELVTGRKPVDSSQPNGDESLVEWARPVMELVLDGGNLDLIADPELNGDYDEKEMMRMVAAAAACVHHSAHKRPRMGQVVRTLEDDAPLSDHDKGGKPSQCPIYDSMNYDSSQHMTVDMKKLRRMGVGSQEYAGSENSATTTTEYGMNRSTSSGEYQTSREVEHSNDGRHRATSSSDLRKDASVSSSNEYPSNSPEEQEGYLKPPEILHEQ